MPLPSPQIVLSEPACLAFLPESPSSGSVGNPTSNKLPASHGVSVRHFWISRQSDIKQLPATHGHSIRLSGSAILPRSSHFLVHTLTQDQRSNSWRRIGGYRCD
ncbi:hypothetical protein CRENBAI_018428 [Crenichthys baileyi]|uniref:Uncharacterized protein n=1 Tax=Crenichthys baileyi TaxID=28760 RepID=A0AAV9SPX9_9TELE